MSDSIQFLLGQILSKQNAMADDIADIKSDMKERVTPVLDDYKTWKNRLIGMCAVISAGIGAAGASINHYWKD